jgi:hypothetical protein
MANRLLALVCLSVAVGCGRQSDSVALDRDTVTLHPASGRLDALLDSAAEAAAHGDTATAHARLADAQAAADEDPTLVYRVAAAGDRLGDGPNAAMDYTHYLTLAPDGPHAREARARVSALMLEEPERPAAASATPPSPAAAAAVATSTAPSGERPAAAARAARTTRRTPRRSRRAAAATAARATSVPASAHRTAAPRIRRPAVVATAPIDSDPRTAAAPPQIVTADAAGETASAATPGAAAVTAAAEPEARSSRGRQGKLAALGAATGALVGAVLGRGTTSAVAGAVLGGAVGAAAGGRNVAPTGRTYRMPLTGGPMTSAGW